MLRAKQRGWGLRERRAACSPPRPPSQAPAEPRLLGTDVPSRGHRVGAGSGRAPRCCLVPAGRQEPPEPAPARGAATPSGSGSAASNLGASPSTPVPLESPPCQGLSAPAPGSGCSAGGGDEGARGRQDRGAAATPSGSSRGEERHARTHARIPSRVPTHVCATHTHPRAHAHPCSGAANLSLAAERCGAAFQHPPASRPAARGTQQESGRWGPGRDSTRSPAGVHPAPPPGWHVLAQHPVAQCGGQMPPKPPTGPGNRRGVSNFPLPEGAQAPSIPQLEGARTNPAHGAAPGPVPRCARPLLSSSRSRAALPLGVPPRARLSPLLQNQPLSKGWSSKIFSRAPSVYHTVNLGFQQLYDAAGRWGENKMLLCSVRHSLHVPVPPAPLARGVRTNAGSSWG